MDGRPRREPEEEPEDGDSAAASSAGTAPAASSSSASGSAPPAGGSCGPTSGPAGISPRRPSTGETGSSASSPSQLLVPTYAVWYLNTGPGGPDLRGLHTGGPRAWDFLLSWLPRQRYDLGNIRCQRFESEPAALAGYRAEAARYRALFPPTVLRH